MSQIEIDKYPRHPQQFYFSRIDWLNFLREVKSMLVNGTNPIEIDNVEIHDSATMLLATLSTLYSIECAACAFGTEPELTDYVNKQISTAILLDTYEVIMLEIITSNAGYQVELIYKSANGQAASKPTLN